MLIAEHGFNDLDLLQMRSAIGISADATAIFGSTRTSSDAYDYWAIYLDKPLVSFCLDGDYNNNGTVEQADLDLVLLHWGAGATPIADTWTNDLPTGAIDQDELDGVLLNWGNTSTAAITSRRFRSQDLRACSPLA